MWITGGYKLDYKEEKRFNGLYVGYERIVSVYGDNDELILSSKDKTEEEFINYLGFLTNEDVVGTAKQLLSNGRTEEDDARDFIEACAEHEYLWW